MESYRWFRGAWQLRGRKRGTANTMESYRWFRGAWQLRGGERGTANTMERYRCFRRAGELQREEERNGQYNGKLPVLQTREVIAKGGREERPIQWKVTGDLDARGN